jgi:hypothetical protein
MKTNYHPPQPFRFSGMFMQLSGTIGISTIAAILAWVAGLALSLSFWPGIMAWDSGRQYAQALSGHFDDWHPPLMEWIWRLLISLMPGPGLMLTLQLGIYSAALGFLAYRTWQHGHRRQAAWLAATGLFPPTLLLMATVIKDSLMAATLLAAFVFLGRFCDTGNRLSRFIGVGLVLIASCLRFNAFLAGLPLLLMAMPTHWARHRGRAAMVIAGATALLLLIMPMANWLLHAKRSGVELSLVIFDLGGITAHGGGNAFPPMAIRNPIEVNQGCYLAERWDRYSWWVDPLCPIQFVTVSSVFTEQRINPELFWIKAILAHPLAYVAHRLDHWNIASQFLVRKADERWITSASDPNDWGFRVEPNLANRAISAAVWAVNSTPAGWPCWWLALSFGLVMLSRRLHQSRQMLALSGSALLYDLGYGVFSVAAELRYYCWSMMAALIATVMFVGRWRETPVALRPGKVHQALAAAPLVLMTLLGLGWRWLG